MLLEGTAHLHIREARCSRNSPNVHLGGLGLGREGPLPTASRAFWCAGLPLYIDKGYLSFPMLSKPFEQKDWNSLLSFDAQDLELR